MTISALVSLMLTARMAARYSCAGSLAASADGVLSRASTLEPAPVGVLDDDKTPDFNKELNIEEILAGTTGAAGTAADDVEATG